MPGLTGDQITFGTKARMQPIDTPPAGDTTGRWRCLLCTTSRYRRWRRGVIQDAHNHYLIYHWKDTP